LLLYKGSPINFLFFYFVFGAFYILGKFLPFISGGLMVLEAMASVGLRLGYEYFLNG
jgi:hypothetical protein